MIKEIRSNLPIISLLFLILATLKQILYYLRYNIVIKNYLTFSEIGLILLDDLAFSCLIMITFIMLFSIKESFSAEDYEDSFTSNYYKKMLKKFKQRFTISVYIIIALLTSVMFIKWNYTSTILGASCIYLALYFIFYINYIGVHQNIFTRYSEHIFLTLVLLCIITFKTAVEITLVDNGLFNNTEIRTSNKIYISNDSIYYVGKTSNYIFLYNSKDKTTDVIPTSEVKHMKIKIGKFRFNKKKKS